MFTHSISAKPQQLPKNRWLSPLLTKILVKNHCRFIAGDLKAFFSIFILWFSSPVKVRGWKLNLQGSAQLSPLSPSPLPSEFCNDENKSVVISAMVPWEIPKKLGS
jgi:hypothetical protein